jgi:NADH dehydrogenase FAD-containing subunit
VSSIDYKNKRVKIEKKGLLSYDKLLIATGSVNKYPEIEGLKGTKFYHLRDKEDCLAIADAIKEKSGRNVTIVGAGFVGMELASAIKLLYKEKVNVNVVEQLEVPF